MYAEYNNRKIITVAQWTEAGLSLDNYKKDRLNSKLVVAYSSSIKGATSIYVDSIRPERLAAIEAKFGPVKSATSNIPNIPIDNEAMAFFTKYEMNMKQLNRYVNTASFFVWMQQRLNDSIEMRSKYGKSVNKGRFFAGCMDLFLNYSSDSECQKINNVRVLQRKYESFLDTGYYALVGNDIKLKDNKNRLKVDLKTEQVLLSIYAGKSTLKGKLFVNEVFEIYTEFKQGNRNIYDRESGELFNPEEYPTLSKSTIWNWINDQNNRRVVDAVRNERHYNQQKHEPYVSRKAPTLSLSKITMDDRDLCRKYTEVDNTGKRVTKWLHTYYAYDVCTGMLVGKSYGKKKDTNLVEDCFRDMFSFLYSNGYKMPAEVEVENHLMSGLRDKLEATFQHVTFCAPENSQQKRAEHFNKSKKWSGANSERRQGMAHGRWYSTHEAYRSSREKIFDGDNDNYKDELVPSSYEEAVAEDMRQIALYNAERLSEFEAKQKKDLLLVNWTQVVYVWGYEVNTSVKRGRSCTVQHEEYWLSNPAIISRLKPNCNSVVAKYIPVGYAGEIAYNKGSINDVFIYQDEKYIDKCELMGKFQEAIVEQTPEDKHIEHKQYQYLRQYWENKQANMQKKLLKLGIEEVKSNQLSVNSDQLSVNSDQLSVRSNQLSVVPELVPAVDDDDDFGFGNLSMDYAQRAKECF